MTTRPSSRYGTCPDCIGGARGCPTCEGTGQAPTERTPTMTTKITSYAQIEVHGRRITKATLEHFLAAVAEDDAEITIERRDPGQYEPGGATTTIRATWTTGDTK